MQYAPKNHRLDFETRSYTFRLPKCNVCKESVDKIEKLVLHHD